MSFAWLVIGLSPSWVLFPLIILGGSLSSLGSFFFVCLFWFFFTCLCWSVLCWVLTEENSQVSGIFSTFSFLSSILCLVKTTCFGLLGLRTFSSVQWICCAQPGFLLFVLQSENFSRTVNWAMLALISERVPFLRDHITFILNVKRLAYILSGFFVIIVALCEKVNLVHFAPFWTLLSPLILFIFLPLYCIKFFNLMLYICEKTLSMLASDFSAWNSILNTSFSFTYFYFMPCSLYLLIFNYLFVNVLYYVYILHYKSFFKKSNWEYSVDT